MHKIMIFGINGFTGWHMQQHIKRNRLTDKYAFVGIDKTIKRPIGIRYIKSDLCQYQSLKRIMKNERPDYIVNLAGILNADTLDGLVKVNAGISRNMLNIILECNLPVKRVILIGSAAEYGVPGRLPILEEAELSPVSNYGLSKLIQSQYAAYYYNNYGINLNVIRVFNIVGKFISPILSIGSFLKQIKNSDNGEDIYVGNLKTRRDFIDIEDAIDGYWKILFKGKPGEVYNLCSGSSVLMKDILDYMIKKSKKDVKVVVNKGLLKRVDVMDIYGSCAKVNRDTGWKHKTGIKSALDKLDYA